MWGVSVRQGCEPETRMLGIIRDMSVTQCLVFSRVTDMSEGVQEGCDEALRHDFTSKLTGDPPEFYTPRLAQSEHAFQRGV